MANGEKEGGIGTAIEEANGSIRLRNLAIAVRAELKKIGATSSEFARALHKIDCRGGRIWGGPVNASYSNKGGVHPALQDMDGNEVIWKGRGNRGGWWCGGKVSRDRIEEMVDAWPTFIDGVEAGLETVKDIEGRVKDKYQNEKDGIVQDIRKLQIQRRAIHEEVKTCKAKAMLYKACVNGKQSVAPPRPLTRLSSAFVPYHTAVESKVYFYVDGDAIVYVGETTNMAIRVKSPERRDWKYDSIWTIDVPVNKRKELESEYIRQFHPKYNRTHSQGWKDKRFTRKVLNI